MISMIRRLGAFGYLLMRYAVRGLSDGCKLGVRDYHLTEMQKRDAAQRQRFERADAGPLC